MSQREAKEAIRRLAVDFGLSGDIGLYRQMCALAILELGRISPALTPLLSGKEASVELFRAFRDAVDHFLAFYDSPGDVHAAVRTLVENRRGEEGSILEILHEGVSFGVSLEGGSYVDMAFWDQVSRVKGEEIYKRRMHALRMLAEEFRGHHT